MSTTTNFRVNGMTCGHCVVAVTEEITRIDGVQAVQVDLRPGEASVVTVASDAPLPTAAVREAVDEAGYELVGSSVESTATATTSDRTLGGGYA